jgi:rhodanese-related sulfurtransferase
LYSLLIGRQISISLHTFDRRFLRKFLNQKPENQPMPSIVDFAVVSQIVSTQKAGGSAVDVPIFLFDVREPDEVANGRIPFSVNVPLDKVSAALAPDSDGDAFRTKFRSPKPALGDRLIFYCLKGGRAANAAKQAEAMGFMNVSVYTGSYTDWVANSGPSST